MLRLINHSDTPPGGFKWFVKETNQHLHAWTMYSLLEKAVAHLKANGLPVPTNLQALIEDYTCQGQGPTVCEEMDPRFGWLSGTVMKFRAVIEGTKILGKWVSDGKPFVPQELADARSEVCAGCVHNIDPQDCQACAWPILTSLVSKILGNRRAKHHDSLKSCASCGCNLRVKVWVPLEHLKASFTYGVLPDWCWLSSEMKNEKH